MGAVVGLVAGSCAGAAGTADPGPKALEVDALAARAPVLYEVAWVEGGALDVVVRVPNGGFGRLTIESGGENFIHGLVARGVDGAPVPTVLRADGLRVPICDGPCTLSYRFDLDRAARAWQNPQFASRVGGAILAPPTSWLLYPTEPSDEPFELAVSVPDGVRFVSGLEERPSGRKGALLSDLPQAPYSAFGDLRVRTIAFGSAEIELAIVGLEPELGDDRIEAWVRAAGEDLAAYFGRLSNDRALIIAIVGPGDSIGRGTALGNGGASIEVHVGVETPEEAFARDWIMTHEMVHLTMPGLHVRHTWLEEGLATYLEPILRQRRGRLGAEEVWRDWHHSMWYGLPLEGDGGLDGTQSWGRIYWGGAVFWLLADLAIREKSGGERSLRDCLRGIAAQNGSIAVRWGVRRLLSVCDAGASVEVVVPLYEEHSASAVHVDLAGLFEGFGVRRGRHGVVLDDAAPRAALRRAITAAERE